jgi:hypothetical protein
MWWRCGLEETTWLAVQLGRDGALPALETQGHRCPRRGILKQPRVDAQARGLKPGAVQRNRCRTDAAGGWAADNHLRKTTTIWSVADSGRDFAAERRRQIRSPSRAGHAGFISWSAPSDSQMSSLISWLNWYNSHISGP